MPTDDKAPESGDLFGKYVIEEKIGAGGMAEVYRARLSDGQKTEFAIKRILPHFSSDENLVSMLINEAKVSVSLRHPNIVPIYDFGRVGGSYYLAMELVRGCNLKDVLRLCRRSGSWMPPAIALYVTMEVLEALAYAHTRRDNFNQPLEIVHRDVSPQNIMISHKGEVKILDFGIAKVRGKAAETKTGVLKGKFSYMSPEQAKAKRVDRRTDLFSAGIMLYEMLTLESPFLADTELQTLENVKRGKYKKPRFYNKNIPKSIEGLLAKAMKKRLGSRFSNAEEFQEAIHKIQKKSVGVGLPRHLKSFVFSLYNPHESTEPIQPQKMPHQSKQYRFAQEQLSSEIFSTVQKKRRRLTKGLSLVAMLVLGFFSVQYIRNDGVHSIKQFLAAKGWLHVSSTDHQPVSTRVAPKKDMQPLLVAAQESLNITFAGSAADMLRKMPFEQYEPMRFALEKALLRRIKQMRSDQPIFLNRDYVESVDGYELSFRAKPNGRIIEVSVLQPN